MLVKRAPQLPRILRDAGLWGCKTFDTMQDSYINTLACFHLCLCLAVLYFICTL